MRWERIQSVCFYPSVSFVSDSWWQEVPWMRQIKSQMCHIARLCMWVCVRTEERVTVLYFAFLLMPYFVVIYTIKHTGDSLLNDCTVIRVWFQDYHIIANSVLTSFSLNITFPKLFSPLLYIAVPFQTPKIAASLTMIVITPLFTCRIQPETCCDFYVS